MSTKTEVKEVSPKTAFINDFMATDPNIEAALEAWKEARGELGTGFKSEFYDELAKGPMDAAALTEFLKGRSANVVKNKANWDGMRKCANRIWELK